MSDRNSLLVRGARAVNPFRRIAGRVLLSSAKHKSLSGHPRIALRLSRWVRSYNYSGTAFFSSDSAPPGIESKRREGFERLATLFRQRFPKSIALSAQLEDGLSDLAFVNSHRVPFQYRQY